MTILCNNMCSSNTNFSNLLYIMFVLSNYNEIIVRTLKTCITCSDKCSEISQLGANFIFCLLPNQ